jgi:uncharacterized ParB-like nuclease family protein
VVGAKPKKEWVPLDRLVREAGLQMRASLADGLTDPATVERYYEAFLEGDEFPPLEVVSDGQNYWLFDGFQRAAAIERAGKGSAECLVFSGSHQDALLRSISANSRHGLTRTTNDCRRAITILIDTPDLLQKVLAQAKDLGGVTRTLAITCGISKGLVGKVLEERNLRVAHGKLVKKPSTRKQDGEAIASNSAPQTEEPNCSSPGNALQTHTEQLTEIHAHETGGSLQSEESNAIRELERARTAVESIWNACRKLLDGPLAKHLLRFAAHHNIPFIREGSSGTLLTRPVANEQLSAIAWWEPLGKIQAVLSDLAATASMGLDRDD